MKSDVILITMIAGAILNISSEMTPKLAWWEGVGWFIFGSILMGIFMDVTHWKP